MNRSIKFRVFDDKLKKFSYFDLFSTFGMIPNDCKDKIDQFTGLTDKDGREIYERDILENKLNHPDYEFGKVIFDQIFCLFGIKYKHLTRTVKFDKYECETRFQIIGNIHENPELFKKT